jgi:GTP-binding protein
VSNFVDECALNVRGGDGGAGCVSFRRESHTPMGGPDGGDGGSGGDVWLVADRNVASLLAFRDHPHRRAASGSHGSGRKRHGASGPDLEVAVPVGTVVRDRDGEVLADLPGHGDRWLAAAGGVGGKGNAKFLSNRRRAPAFAEQGEAGEERWVWLDLKLLADVAIIGFPNVGKSTLIARISAARPKIGDYPFTTLEPQLGVVRLGEGTDAFEMVVADVPGLIEGAAEGRGLGHRFLRHVERARVLLVLCDLSPTAVTGPAEQYSVLIDELERYQVRLGSDAAPLVERPRVVAGSRSDLAAAEALESWCEGNELPPEPDADEGRGDLPLAISAVTGKGVDRLLGQLRRQVEQARTLEPKPEGFVTLRPVPEGVRVTRRDDASFEVLGRAALRAVGFSDLTQSEALDEARRRLDRLGVDRALARAGARNGDLVHIGALTFTYDTADELDVQPFDEAPAIRRDGPSRGGAP